jgi:predicted MFS family arabinose efflux permease
MPPESFQRRVIEGVTMFVVTAMSLLLLAYVGFGEGKRTYEQIQIEKLTAQGRIVQNALENFLRDGLPLGQFAGFNTLVEPIVGLEEIDAIAAYDQTGRQIFIVVDKQNPKLPTPSQAIKVVNDKIEVEYGETHYQVVLPLRTRFETAGSIVVVSPTNPVDQRIRVGFYPLLYVVAGLSALFAVSVSIAGRHLAAARGPWLQIGYALIFLTMSGAVIGTLISLYYDGIRGKANASAFTLSQRLSDIVEFKLNIEDFDGLDTTFSEFRRLNPEIKEAALVIDGVVQIDTSSKKLGKIWVSDSGTYEHRIDLSGPSRSNRASLIATVPRDVVYQRVQRSVKNFAALFVASAFLAGLFLQLAMSVRRLGPSSLQANAGHNALPNGEMALIIVKPVFFLAVFLDSLTYSFLPKFMQDAAMASGVSVGFASMPFTAYYLCFALSLIPAGNYADRNGPRPLIWFGLILAGTSVLSLAMPLGIASFTALRALSGVGQGMLFIGIQTYILAVASPGKKTQGAAIIVFGFQGGMISGMAIGSLLVNYLQPHGVFAISGVVGFATALYSILLMPRDLPQKHGKSGLAAAIHRVINDLKRVISSGEFLKTMFCIGVPAKAILTGTITFALPLLLGQQQYRQEDIGQIIMLYGLGVVAASGYVSRLVDRTGETKTILFWGAAISGMGLALIGLMGSHAVGNGLLSTIMVIIGVIVVGIAHGFINAPVVTHVAHSELALQIGVNPVTTTYRFLERIGHVTGPFLVSQLFLFCGQTPQVIGWIGIGTATLGLLFIARILPPRKGTVGSEAVS